MKRSKKQSYVMSKLLQITKKKRLGAEDERVLRTEEGRNMDWRQQ